MASNWRLVLTLAALCCCADAWARAQIDLECGESTTDELQSSTAQGTVSTHGSRDAWLEVEELGVATKWRDESAALPLQASVPPRYGHGFLRVSAGTSLSVSRELEAAAPGRIAIRLICDPTEHERRVIGWYESVGRVAATPWLSLSSRDADASLNVLARAQADAPSAREAAWAQHLAAQAQLLAGRSEAASAAFASAEAAWLAIGDQARALAARVGRVEDLVRSGKYEAALELTALKGQATEVSYYSVRLGISRCAIFRYLGRLADADTCFESGIAALLELGERAEVSSNLIDRGEVKRTLGQPEDAELFQKRALELAAGPWATIITGRAHLALSDLSLDVLQITPALSHIDSALEAFQSANASRWSANALLKGAGLYEALGALPEADAMVDQALSMLSEKDAPARVAAGMVVKSRVQMQRTELDGAIASLRNAERIYTSLRMELELDVTRSELAAALLANNEGASASRLLQARGRGFPLTRSLWSIIEAHVALLEGRNDSALATTRALQRRPLGLAEIVHVATIRSRAQLAIGRPNEALASLSEAATRLDRVSLATSNPVLRHILRRRLEPLRASAAVVLASNESGGFPAGSADAAFAWLVRAKDNGGSQAGKMSSNPEIEGFDRLVAQEVFGMRRSNETPERRLISVLAERSAAMMSSRAVRPTLAQIQRRLSPDALFVGHLDGGSVGLVLWVSRDRVFLRRAPTAKDLRGQAAQLRRLIGSASTPLLEIGTLTRAVLSELVPPELSRKVPRFLTVDRDGVLADLPWTVLSWPRQSEPLLATTEITLAPLDTTLDQSAGPRHEMVVLVSEGGTSGVARLPNARAEPRVVQEALAGSGIATRVIPNASRSDILAALSSAGWAHVAAHGSANPERIGYAGIWIASATDTNRPPDFLGWLDVLSRGSSAGLVVLDACHLGASANDAGASLGFSTALSRAGARDVVSALWPLSDAASAIWTGAFYKALVHDPAHSPPAALRSAQLRMRETRMFRHPFYWASLVSYSSSL